MIRVFLSMAPALALVVSPPAPAAAQAPVDSPRLRAALHEMREARNHLRDARDVWPPGEKKRAEQAIQSAIESVRTILAIKDVDTFRGVDRNPDYYGKYRDHPRLRAALDDLRDAREELRSSRQEFGGHKDRALDDLDVAAGSIVHLIRHGRK
jgi:hypothetical protein